jgi:hypothetical protein
VQLEKDLWSSPLPTATPPHVSTRSPQIASLSLTARGQATAAAVVANLEQVKDAIFRESKGVAHAARCEHTSSVADLLTHTHSLVA